MTSGRVLKAAGWAAAVAALLFTAFPGLDLWASSLFFVDGDFVLRKSPPAEVVLDTLRNGARAIITVLVAYLLVRLAIDRRRWLEANRGLIALMLCLALGPGLLVNGVLKESWGRARPKEVMEFGGIARFTPALQPADQCPHNCSFPAGDPSVAFATLSVALLVGRRRRLAVAAALGLGAAVGALRMAEGAHFLSDVVFSGIVTAAVAAPVHRWMIEGRAAADWRTLRGRPRRSPRA